MVIIYGYGYDRGARLTFRTIPRAPRITHLNELPCKNVSGRDRVEQNRRRSARCLFFFTACPTVSIKPSRYYSTSHDNSLVDSCHKDLYQQSNSRRIRNGVELIRFDNF